MASSNLVESLEGRALCSAAPLVVIAVQPSAGYPTATVTFATAAQTGDGLILGNLLTAVAAGRFQPSQPLSLNFTKII